MTPKEMALTAAKALDEKKGGDIAAIEITEQTTLADYFVIATGSSNTQINALVDNVEKVLREEAQEEPLHREGYRAGTWVLLDYGCEVEMNPDKEAFRERALPTWSIFTDQYGTELVDLLQQTQGD